MAMFKQVCSTCGSDDVLADATARWDADEQRWEVTNISDKGHSCNECDGECKIEQVELPYRMAFPDWVARYQPIKNTVDHSYNSLMFETYGVDMDRISRLRETAPSTIWTLHDEGGDRWISAGYHMVNRLGFFITKFGFNEADSTLEIDA